MVITKPIQATVSSPRYQCSSHGLTFVLYLGEAKAVFGQLHLFCSSWDATHGDKDTPIYSFQMGKVGHRVANLTSKAFWEAETVFSNLFNLSKPSMCFLVGTVHKRGL